MTIAEELPASAPVPNPDDIEQDIGDLVRSRNAIPPAIRVIRDNDHPLPKAPLPDYVAHKDGVNQVGKLTAEAVVREYDAAVKEIEALGAELTEAARSAK